MKLAGEGMSNASRRTAIMILSISHLEARQKIHSYPVISTNVFLSAILLVLFKVSDTESLFVNFLAVR